MLKRRSVLDLVVFEFAPQACAADGEELSGARVVPSEAFKGLAELLAAEAAGASGAPPR